MRTRTRRAPVSLKRNYALYNYRTVHLTGQACFLVNFNRALWMSGQEEMLQKLPSPQVASNSLIHAKLNLSLLSRFIGLETGIRLD